MKFSLHFRSSLLAFLLLVIFSFFSNFQASAQQKKRYNLLWEISGNGLTKPSYIFGTLSIKDKRVFNFSDSVYIALANSDGFALEFHPDTLLKASFANLNNTSQKDKEQGTDPPKMEAKTNVEVSANSFLYGLARTYRKKIYGLDLKPASEIDVETHEKGDLTEEEDEEEKSHIERIIALYEIGDVDNLWGEIRQYLDETEYADRNEAMTKELLRIINNESIFTTATVSFLLGDNGAINYLKKAGYKVRAVGANFTDVAKNYKTDYKKMEWQQYVDDSHHFNVNFPAAPYITKNANTTKIITYADLVNNAGYTATTLYTGPVQNVTSEAYVDTVFNRFIKNVNGKILSKTKFEKFGSVVIEAEIETANRFSKNWMIHVNNTFYTFTVEVLQNRLKDDFVDLFFNSIAINRPSANSANNWIQYNNNQGGFTVQVPAQPDEIKREVPNPTLPKSPYLINMYQSTNKISLMNYIIRYNDFPTGMYLADKNGTFNMLIKEFETRGKLITKPTVIYKDGMEGRAVDLTAGGSYMEIQSYIKGNRIYLLMRQNMNGESKPAADQFFSSFKVKNNQTYKAVDFQIGDISIKMPENPIIIEKTDEEIEDQKKGESFLIDEQSFFAVNRNTGGVYGITKSLVSKYYRQKNIDTLITTLVKNLTKNSSTNPKIEYFNLDGLKGATYTTTDSLANTSKKTKIWFQADHCYLQTLTSDDLEVNDEQANIYFNSTINNNKKPLFNFNSSKASLIVRDLSGIHLPTQQLALGALSFYEFDKEELPIIYSALEKKYTNDTSRIGTRISLLEVLQGVSDEQTSTLLKKLYQDNRGADLVQSEILALVPKIDAKSYDWYLKSLTDAPVFNLKNYWNLFSPLTDSLAYSASNFDQIVKFSKEKLYRPMVLDLVSTMLNDEESEKYLPILQSKKELIGKYALEDAETDVVKINKGEYPQTVNDYLAILPKLNLINLTDSYTKKIILIDSLPHIKTNAIAARIKTNLPVDESLLNTQLDSLQSRFAIMSAYNSINKLQSIPAKYREHAEFAKLLLSEYAASEYGYPLEFKLLGNTKSDKGTYYVFEYVYEEEGERKSYLGVSGAFNDDANKLDFNSYSAYTKFDIKENDWLKQAKTLIAELEIEE